MSLGDSEYMRGDTYKHMFVSNNNRKLVSKYKESWNFTVVNYDTNHFGMLRAGAGLLQTRV